MRARTKKNDQIGTLYNIYIKRTHTHTSISGNYNIEMIEEIMYTFKPIEKHDVLLFIIAAAAVAFL